MNFLHDNNTNMHYINTELCILLSKDDVSVLSFTRRTDKRKSVYKQHIAVRCR